MKRIVGSITAIIPDTRGNRNGDQMAGHSAVGCFRVVTTAEEATALAGLVDALAIAKRLDNRETGESALTDLFGFINKHSTDKVWLGKGDAPTLVPMDGFAWDGTAATLTVVDVGSAVATLPTIDAALAALGFSVPTESTESTESTSEAPGA